MRKAARASIVAGAAAGAVVIACGTNHSSPDAKKGDAPIDTKVIDASPDGPSFDFSCIGMQPAGSGSAMITLSGTVTDVAFTTTLQFTAGSNASITVCKNQAINCNGQNRFGGPTTTNGSGQWSIGPMATANSPLDAFVHMTPPATGSGSTVRPANVYPAFPFLASLANIPVPGLDPSFLVVARALGAPQQQAGNGLFVVALTDCASKPISGATIHAQQGGVDQGTVFEPQAMGSGAGGYFVFNVPPGATTLTATVGTMTFRTSPAQVVTSVADETTVTQIRPGP
jgi:hypothetical protein